MVQLHRKRPERRCSVTRRQGCSTRIRPATGVFTAAALLADSARLRVTDTRMELSPAINALRTRGNSESRRSLAEMENPDGTA